MVIERFAGIKYFKSFLGVLPQMADPVWQNRGREWTEIKRNEPDLTPRGRRRMGGQGTWRSQHASWKMKRSRGESESCGGWSLSGWQGTEKGFSMAPWQF